MKQCSVDGCGKKTKGRGYCSMHLKRLHTHGQLELPTKKIYICVADGCQRKAHGRIYCGMHRDRLNRNGTLETLPVVTLEQRFWRRVDKSNEQGCWLWTGTKVDGYGQISINGKGVRAHRLSYKLATGNDPGDLLVCHTCDQRDCVNPSHFFLGTDKDNSRDRNSKGRSWQQKKTHCPQGHELVDGNLVLSKIGRSCRKCVNERAIKYRKNKIARQEQANANQ
jgi:hypothetical protein